MPNLDARFGWTVAGGLYLFERPVARESIRAMGVRTTICLLILRSARKASFTSSITAHETDGR